MGIWAPSRPEGIPPIGAVLRNRSSRHVDVRLNIDFARRTPDIAKTRSSQVHKLTEGDFAAMVSAVNARPVLLGRDVGMVNTVSYGAILRDREVTADDLRNAVNLKTKDQCRDHILSHWHPCEPLVKDGTPFLRRHSGSRVGPGNFTPSRSQNRT